MNTASSPRRFPTGEELLACLQTSATTADDVTAAQTLVAQAVASMDARCAPMICGRSCEEFESPYWDDVASRCLACQNCTMDPPCFCHVRGGRPATSQATWTNGIGSGVPASPRSIRLHTNFVRASTGSRYRQWITHKLGAWNDQFGMSGCGWGVVAASPGARLPSTSPPRSPLRDEQTDRVRDDHANDHRAARRQSVLHGLPAPVIAQVAGCAGTARFERGDMLFQRGNRPTRST